MNHATESEPPSAGARPIGSSDRGARLQVSDTVESPMECTTGPARIGPNAISQLQAVLCKRIGPEAAASLLTSAALDHYRAQAPSEMVDQAEVARLHHQVRCSLPHEQALELMAEAGDRTGGYILAHRIPRVFVALLPILPERLSSRLLMRAIAAHSWTFAGSGEFRIARDPTRTACLIAEIAANPVVALDRSEGTICHWHAAVFQRLFRALVSPRTVVRETDCCAAGAPCCRFEIRLGGASGGP